VEVQLDAVGDAAPLSVMPGEREVAVDRLKRPLVGIASIDVLLGLIGRCVEGLGAVEYECSADCWCQRSVLSLFRCVFPYGHRCGEACESEAVNGA
jgi:hypothetical protein